MKCGDCKFWRAMQGPPEVVNAGECHRRAPVPVSEAVAVILGTIRDRGVSLERQEPSEEIPSLSGFLWDRKALWPATLHSDFCGEFVFANGKGPGFV